MGSGWIRATFRRSKTTRSYPTAAAALIAPDGAVKWPCLPRIDSSSVFGAVVDRDAGRFRLGPAGRRPFRAAASPATLVVETTRCTSGGWLVVTDALLIGPWHHDEHERSRTHRRAPTDYDAAHVLFFIAQTAKCRWAWTALPGSTMAGCLHAGPTPARRYHEAVADRGRFPDHPWRGHLQRSALTLKGLSFSSSGAIMAAATTSLPETPGGERNWDYRYTWIRDAAKTLWALNALGRPKDFFRLVDDDAEAENGDLQLMYGGTAGPGRQRRLHPSSARRVGCDATCDRPAHRSASSGRRSAVADRADSGEAGARALVRTRPGASEEVRSGPQHFTISKVASWMAADAGARIAEVRGENTLAAQWRAAADEIRADVLVNAVDQRGVFTQHYDTKTLDASVLLIPLVGFLQSSDQRVRNTVLAIADELTKDEIVLRYHVDETQDGLSGKEGIFTICSFWLVSALVDVGELVRAKTLDGKLLSSANSLGHYAEEIDPHSGRHLGNFPRRSHTGR